MKTANTLSKKQRLKIEALCNKGQYDDARRQLLTICEKAPQNKPAWFLLGNISIQVKDIGGASTCYKNILQISPGDKLARSNLAKCFVQLAHVQKHQGNAQKALELYYKALEFNPDNIDALKPITTHCVESNDLSNAIVYVKKIAQLTPSDAENQNNLAIMLERVSGMETAIQYYKKAFELEPDNINYQLNMATSLTFEGAYNESETILKEILKNYPENVRATYFLLEVYYRKKMPEQAKQIIEHYLDNNSDEIPLSLLCKFLEICQILPSCIEVVELAENKLESCDSAEQDPHPLHFLLGRYYDKHEQYEKAFKHIDAGNRMKDENTGIYEFRLSQMQRTCTTIDKQRFTDIPSSNETSELPVFVVGMPRSGTSLVEQILACHPQVQGIGENQALNIMLNDFSQLQAQQKTFPEYLFSMSEGDMQTMSTEYLNMLGKNAETDNINRIINKLPSNCVRLTIIKKLFPNSRIIHCIRNPMDTCLSIYFQLFQGMHSYAYNLKKLGTFYRNYQKVMKHQTETLGIEVMDIHYEDLVNDQEHWSKQLVDYLGLEWDAACLNFDKSGRHVKTASVDQVNKPIYSSSIHRWKHYEKYLGPLKEALGYSEQTQN